MASQTASATARARDYAMLNSGGGGGGGGGTSTHDMLTSLARSHGLKAIQARQDRIRRAHRQRAVIAQAHQHSQQQRALQAARKQGSLDGRSTTGSTGSTTFHSALHEHVSVASRPMSTAMNGYRKTHPPTNAEATNRAPPEAPVQNHPKKPSSDPEPNPEKFDLGNFLQGMFGMKTQKQQETRRTNLSAVLTETSSDECARNQKEVSKTSSSSFELSGSPSPRQSSGSTPPAKNTLRSKNAPPPIPETIVIDTSPDE